MGFKGTVVVDGSNTGIVHGITHYDATYCGVLFDALDNVDVNGAYSKVNCANCTDTNGWNQDMCDGFLEENPTGKREHQETSESVEQQGDRVMGFEGITGLGGAGSVIHGLHDAGFPYCGADNSRMIVDSTGKISDVTCCSCRATQAFLKDGGARWGDMDKKEEVGPVYRVRIGDGFLELTEEEVLMIRKYGEIGGNDEIDVIFEETKIIPQVLGLMDKVIVVEQKVSVKPH